MNKLFYLIIIFVNFFFLNLYGEPVNQNISKLNNLYLNGVLNKEAYISSLTKLGLDTQNDIFSNLFDLFENNVIELKEYEKSIINLISISNPIEPKDINLSNNFQFNIDNCHGQAGVCSIFIDRGLIEVELFEDKLKFSEDYKSNLLSHGQIASIQKEEFKLNGTNAKVSMVLTNIGGIIFKLNLEGKFDGRIFAASKFDATQNGQFLVRGKLSQKN